MASGLATRCPACGTVFRVVLDQLRVSEGWVRCGRCSDVFNAAETLVDLESGAARPLVLDAPPPGSRPRPAMPAQDTPAGQEGTPFIDSAAAQQDAEDTAEPPPPAAPPPDPPDPPETLETLETPETLEIPDPPAVLEDFEPAVADSSPTPSFLRRAERDQRWQQPRVRAALAGLAVAAALALAAQATYEFRDLIAAHLPATRAGLAATCQALGCSIGVPHAIETISVESSGLVRVEKSSLYRLAVALRNRAAFDVAMPALELAVTDAQGKLIARRVLLPAEMGVSQPQLGAGRDLLLQATLQLAADPVSGYTIEPFYP